MSKSKGNVISPSTIIERYGVDTARCYILFIGPPDQDADWSDSGVQGMHRFLARLWRVGADVAEQVAQRPPLGPDDPQGDDRELLRKAHWAIEKVTNDMSGRFAFNTAIAARDGADERDLPPARPGAAASAALRGRDRGLADLPVRPAHGRRGLRAR